MVSRITELLATMEERALNPEEQSELSDLLDDPKHRAELVEHFHMNEMLHGYFCEPDERWAIANSADHTSSELVAKTSLSFLSRLARAFQIQLSPLKLSLAASGIALMVVFFWIFQTSNTQSPAIAHITEAKGNIRWILQRGTVPAQPKMALFSGTQIASADANSSALITYVDSSWIKIDGNTQIGLDNTKKGKKIRLDHGRLVADLKKQDKRQPFLFITHNARAVVLGTRLVLEVDETETRLQVEEGTVRFIRNHDQKSIDVTQGNRAAIGASDEFTVVEAHPNLDRMSTLKDANSSLVAHYSFDVQQGERVADRSGKGHVGRIEWPSSLQTEGHKVVVGDAPRGAFDANRATIRVQHHSSLCPPHLSISLLFRFSKTGTLDQHNLLLSKTSMDEKSGYSLEAIDGYHDQPGVSIRFRIWTEQGPQEVSFSLAQPLSWHHLAVSFDEDQLKMYHNGRLVDVKDCFSVKLLSNQEDLKIGPFSGLIDEVKIFDRGISSNEVQVLSDVIKVE